jgi:hypothetical protein
MVGSFLRPQRVLSNSGMYFCTESTLTATEVMTKVALHTHEVTTTPIKRRDQEDERKPRPHDSVGALFYQRNTVIVH